MTDGETDQGFFHDGLYTKTINEIGTCVENCQRLRSPLWRVK